MILYVCDGKVPKCGGAYGCMEECYHTQHVEHARYGECEGEPEWYPERFAELDKDIWVEKKKW